MDLPSLVSRITGARVEVRNFSMAPKHRQDRDFVLRGESVEGWSSLITALLEDTQVNGVISLAEHVQLTLDDEREALQRVFDARPPKPERGEGGSIATLALCGASEAHLYSFNESNTFGERVAALHRLVVAQGERRELGQWGEAEERLPLRPSAPIFVAYDEG